MYSTCPFCHAALGRNEVIEAFPVGRRLAFDAHRGRLWVVCRACRNWNLSPLESFWEAVEACERIFRATPIRVSTEHIGLAVLSEGLELVRVGKPLRPEFAAWRYGPRIRQRRLRGAGMAVSTALHTGTAWPHRLWRSRSPHPAVDSFATPCCVDWSTLKLARPMIAYWHAYGFLVARCSRSNLIIWRVSKSSHTTTCRRGHSDSRTGLV